MANMRRNRDGSLVWVASNWWARLRAQKGKGRFFNAIIIKISTTHALHADSALQFIEYLIRHGDHSAAWEACTPPVRHRIGVKALAVQDAQKAVSATITATVKKNEQAANKKLERIAEALEKKRTTLDTIRRIMEEDDAPHA